MTYSAPSQQPKSNKTVPVLITWDMDPDLWIPCERRQGLLNTAMDLCHSQGIRATFFFTAQPADAYLDEFDKMRAQGHELGCHGLTHGDEENYDRMSEPMQCVYIEQATERLQNLIGEPIRAFRSPHVKTSATTLSLLARNGYLADSSVCSQRIDFVSSNLINIGWIFAPRRPYRPHRDSAFRSGALPIWEIPVSAAVIPFISSALRVLGLPSMKVLFRLLHAESRRTGKPIVYLAHPTEFKARSVKGKRGLWKVYVRREYLTPSFIRAHGLRLRNLLYRVDGEALYQNTQELFAYMASFPDVTFMTVSEYAIRNLGEGS
jgi:hypothetical protein